MSVSGARSRVNTRRSTGLMRIEDLQIGVTVKRYPDDGWRGVVIAARTKESPEARFAVVPIYEAGGSPAIHDLFGAIADLLLDLDSFEVVKSMDRMPQACPCNTWGECKGLRCPCGGGCHGIGACAHSKTCNCAQCQCEKCKSALRDFLKDLRGGRKPTRIDPKGEFRTESP